MPRDVNLRGGAPKQQCIYMRDCYQRARWRPRCARGLRSLRLLEGIILASDLPNLYVPPQGSIYLPTSPGSAHQIRAVEECYIFVS